MFSRAPISKLCCDVLLLSGAAIPAGRYRSILRDSPAGLIPCAEGELGLGRPLAQPLHPATTLCRLCHLVSHGAISARSARSRVAIIALFSHAQPQEGP